MLIRALPAIRRRVPGRGAAGGRRRTVPADAGEAGPADRRRAATWCSPARCRGTSCPRTTRPATSTRCRAAPATRGLDVEGLGIVYLEASATGLPVVAGDSGGAPDAVLEGETGYVVGGRDVGPARRPGGHAARRPGPGPPDGCRRPGLGGAGVALGDPGRERMAGAAHRLSAGRPAGRPGPPVASPQRGRAVGRCGSADPVEDAAAGPGRPKCQPWPASQPMARSRSACSAVSTPSAVTVRSERVRQRHQRWRGSARRRGRPRPAARRPGHEGAGDLQLVHRQVAAGRRGCE